MVDTGIFFSNMKSLRMLNVILTLDKLQWLPNRSDVPPIFMTLKPGLTFTESRVVSMEHLQRVLLASREHLSFRTPGSVPVLGTCLCSNCWDQFYRTYRIFTWLFTWNTPRCFLDFALRPVLLPRHSHHFICTTQVYDALSVWKLLI